MTTAMSRAGYFMMVAVLLGGLALAPPARGGGATSDGQPCAPVPDDFTNTLADNLRTSGFQVSQGCPMLYPVEGCKEYTYPALKNCFLNNPAAPYVIPVMPSWPDEYIDPAMVNSFGPTLPGYSATYRLDPREAIVIYGQMPPPGRYIGLQTFQLSQDGHWKAKDYDHWTRQPDLVVPMEYLFTVVPPDDPRSNRVITFSSLGDIVNNAVMEKKSGDPFGQRRYFIITPSGTTDDAVRGALHALGVPDSYIFTEQIPPKDDLGPIGPLGMDKKAVDFVTAFRYAAPDPGYEEAAKEWRAAPPLTILRVRGSRGAARPYPSLTFEPRKGVDEAYLARDLQDLVQAVCKRAKKLKLESTDCERRPPASSFMADLVRDYGWTGPYCRKIHMDCLGDQNDAAYFFSPPLPLDSGEIYAVVDTLATTTGNATYTALSVNDPSLFNGITAILDTDLESSASSYAATVKNTDKFFVYYFTRHCDTPTGLDSLTGTWCMEITEGMVPRQGDSTKPGDPALHGMVTLGLRDYVASGTQRGPDASKVLTPRVLKFTPR